MFHVSHFAPASQGYELDIGVNVVFPDFFDEG
jgi:hypothetical protein